MLMVVSWDASSPGEDDDESLLLKEVSWLSQVEFPDGYEMMSQLGGQRFGLWEPVR